MIEREVMLIFLLGIIAVLLIMLLIMLKDMRNQQLKLS